MTNISKKCSACGQELKKCLTCGQGFNNRNTETSENYRKPRVIILSILIAELAVGIWFLWTNPDFASPLNKFLFGVLAGILGLTLRNCVWLFGIRTESQQNKPLKRIYLLQYQSFVVFSSILISSVLMLNGKIEDSSYLFFTFALPLNIYVGLEAYNAVDLLKDVIRRNV